MYELTNCSMESLLWDKRYLVLRDELDIALISSQSEGINK